MSSGVGDAQTGFWNTPILFCGANQLKVRARLTYGDMCGCRGCSMASSCPVSIGIWLDSSYNLCLFVFPRVLTKRQDDRELDQWLISWIRVIRDGWHNIRMQNKRRRRLIEGEGRVVLRSSLFLLCFSPTCLSFFCILSVTR